MKRVLAAALLFICAPPAIADDESDAREAVKSLVDDLVVHRSSNRLDEFRGAILKSGKAGAIWVEETRKLLPFTPVSLRGEMMLATKCLFESQPGLLVEPVRALLTDESMDAAVWGTDITQYLHLAPELSAELLSLFDREDRAVIGMGYGVFQGVVDPKVTERLVTEAKKPGERGFAALFALMRVETEDAHKYLRAVSGDKAEDEDRRRFALAGLEPFLGEEDRKAALEALASEDPVLVRAAFLAFCESGVVPPPDALRAARSFIDEELQEKVDDRLIRGGDEAALEDVMKRAASTQDIDDKRQLYQAAAMSPLPARIAKSRKVVEAETDPRVREPLLLALGASGDPAVLEILVPFLNSSDDCDTACTALVSLTRSGGVQLRPAVLLALKPKNPDLLQTFVGSWMGDKPVAADRIALGKILLDLLEKNLEKPITREALEEALANLSDQQFEGERQSVAKWQAWLDHEIQKERKE